MAYLLRILTHGRWYTEDYDSLEVAPSFAELATMRRQCWTIWVSDQAQHGRLDQKSPAPLLDVVGYG